MTSHTFVPKLIPSCFGDTLNLYNIKLLNATQRIRAAESRALEPQVQREERLRQIIARTKAEREKHIATARLRELQRQRTSCLLTSESFICLAFEYEPDISYSAHSKIATGAMDKV